MGQVEFEEEWLGACEHVCVFSNSVILRHFNILVTTLQLYLSKGACFCFSPYKFKFNWSFFRQFAHLSLSVSAFYFFSPL